MAGQKLNAEQLESVIQSLSKQLKEKKSSQRKVQTTLLIDFLKRARKEKLDAIKKLKAEIETLTTDINASCAKKTGIGEAEGALITDRKNEGTKVKSELEKDIGGTPDIKQEEQSPAMIAKRRRAFSYFPDLQSHYFATVAPRQGEERQRYLRKFTDDIANITQYNRFRCRASLLHVARMPEIPGTDLFKASNIVSSIEFDRDSEFLATAGVTKRIKLFEFSNILDHVSQVHYPVSEINAPAKLSWVCWDPYIKYHLVSADYEGIVTLWDTNRGEVLTEYEEHEKRAWSVDFCTADPRYFASGSDDGRVKLWKTTQSNSVLTIENRRANICSVKWEPDSSHRLAFGSADYNVHYYDIRSPKQPLHVFKSHQRTVSYVKFMSPTELVSACVDSTIKLWDLTTMSLKRTFTGHLHDKNFVGLSVTSDFIACGSESNTLYGYYKAVPRPVTNYRFPNADPLTGEETQDDDESFVSSVCWCPKHPTMLVSANSLGVIKVLQLANSDEESTERDSNEGSD